MKSICNWSVRTNDQCHRVITVLEAHSEPSQTSNKEHFAKVVNGFVPKLNSHLRFWKRYVDDTLTIVKEGSINHLLQQLNSFHPKIQFTFEIESSGRIPFLDILIIRKKSKIETTVYRKSTDTGIYLNWFSFAPNTWKRGTLKNLVHRAYNICSREYLLRKELLHLEKMFLSRNSYPRCVIKQILTQVEKKQHERNNMNNNNSDDSNTNN